MRPANVLILSSSYIAAAAAAAVEWRQTSTAFPGLLNLTHAQPSNPLFEGWYADPEIRIYDGKFWIFPTTSVAFKHQSSFDAFSSPDLATWTKHPNILTPHGVKWARDNFWAPTSVRGRDDRYYFYFSANGLRTKHKSAGLGVAVADAPEGPYVDALGKRLVDSIINGANPMDPDVFVDDDGVRYLYFGGSALNVALLNDDMVSFRSFPDKTIFKDVTPSSTFREGVKVFKRNGTYYMMWSENGYGEAKYQVAYGMASSPLGPFTRRAVILGQDPDVAVATGHNSVFNVAGTDEWWIVYHRRPLTQKIADHRVVAMDRLYFDAQGGIKSVVIT